MHVSWGRRGSGSFRVFAVIGSRSALRDTPTFSNRWWVSAVCRARRQNHLLDMFVDSGESAEQQGDRSCFY